MSILKDSTLPTYGESSVTCLEEEIPFDEPPSFSQDIQDPHYFDFEFHSSDFKLKKLFKIDFDMEAFDNHILAETSHLEDDCSHSSCFSSISAHSEFSSCKEIVQMINDASEPLDGKLEDIMDLLNTPST